MKFSANSLDAKNNSIAPALNSIKINKNPLPQKYFSYLVCPCVDLHKHVNFYGSIWRKSTREKQSTQKDCDVNSLNTKKMKILALSMISCAIAMEHEKLRK